MPIRITGIKELRAALKDVDRRLPSEVTAALREGARTVTALSNQLAPRDKGTLSANGRPFSTTKAAGVRYTLIYAGVQEFATRWQRHTPGGSGVEQVHYTKNGPPPRFAYRAANQLAEPLMEETFERLVTILRAQGWFDR